MEFNLSTFVLEIINFLILIWILQRLFYKPLLNVIAKRKQLIDQSLAAAKSLQIEAEQQRSLYENRQKLWEQERQTAITSLQLELDTERTTQLNQLNIDLEQERQKAKVTLSRQQQELQQQAEKQALQNGAKFASLLLQQTAGQELESRLFTLTLNKLTTLPEVCKLNLTMPENKTSVMIKVTSAFPLSLEMSQQLEQKLESLINTRLIFQYHQDAVLIAGLRIDIGAWVLNANLLHELIGFTEFDYESK